MIEKRIIQVPGKRHYTHSAALYRRMLMALALLYVLYHLFTLPLSPLPWFDEVFYADVTDSYMRNHNFELKISPVFYTGEVRYYGPVYFYVQSLICKLAGFNVFQFRLLNLISGLLIMVLGTRFLQKLQVSKTWILFFVIALSTETLYNQVLHCGRMDLFAVLLMLLSYYYYFAFRESGRSHHLLFAAFFLGVSLLTTPRIIFAGAFYAVDFIYTIIRHKSLKSVMPYLIMASVAGILYTCWIYASYGGYQNYIGSLGFLSEYVGNTSFLSSIIRHKYHINLWVCLITLLFVYIANLSLFTVKEKYCLRFCLANMVGFHLLVREAGPYSAMVMPFYLLFISIVLYKCSAAYRYLKVLVYLLLIPNIALFLLKGSVIMECYAQRNPLNAEKMIAAVIPRGSKVVANFEYFYALKANGCVFECIELGESVPDRFTHQSTAFDFDYLIINNRFVNAESAYYLRHSNYQSVQLITGHSNGFINWFFEVAKEAGFSMSAGYNGVIYKRIR